MQACAALLLVSSAFLSACSALSTAGTTSRSELALEIRRLGLDPSVTVLPFAAGEEARRWLAENVPVRKDDSAQLDVLLAELISADGLALVYERTFTGTADEVFHRRSANCLGFVNLFVALARERGLNAFFVLIEDQSLYDREGDLVLVSDHVAAGFRVGGVLKLLDFSEAGGPPPERHAVRRLTDLEALAKYYSNRGAEMLREGRARAALGWLEPAIRLAPHLAPTWVNLGVARRRTADLAGAEEAYRTALELDPASEEALQNLGALLKLKGEETEAFGLLALSGKLAAKNPFSFLALGDWSLEAGRMDDARRYYERALGVGTANGEASAALGELEHARGNLRKARRWFKRAQHADAQNERTLRLAQKLSP